MGPVRRAKVPTPQNPFLGKVRPAWSAKPGYAGPSGVPRVTQRVANERERLAHVLARLERMARNEQQGRRSTRGAVPGCGRSPDE